MKLTLIMTISGFAAALLAIFTVLIGLRWLKLGYKSHRLLGLIAAVLLIIHAATAAYLMYFH